MDLSNHSTLCEVAARWLKRPHSQAGPGCKIAVTEPRSGHSGGESPDAIGWRRAGSFDGTYLVEVKVSRSDFQADKAKLHRMPSAEDFALGNVRFYLCPEDVIQVDDLPAQWGLLWATRRGHIRSLVNPFAHDNHVDRRHAVAEAWQASNHQREMFILVGMLSRLESPEKIDKQLRRATSEQQRLARLADKRQDTIRDLQRHRLQEQHVVSEVQRRAPSLHAQIMRELKTPRPPQRATKKGAS